MKNTMTEECHEETLKFKGGYLKKYEADISEFAKQINEKILSDSLSLKDSFREQCRSEQDDLRSDLKQTC